MPESLPFLLIAWPLTVPGGGAQHDLLLTIIDLSRHDPGRCLPILLNGLDAPTEDMRSVAAWGVGKLGYIACAAVPALERMLASTNSYSEFSAVVALGKVTNSVPVEFPRLHDLTLATNAQVAAGAALTLWRWGQPVEQSVTALTNLLWSKQGKGLAAEYLAEIGGGAKTAVPVLLQASHEDIGAWVDRYDRAKCALAVLQIGGANDFAVKELEDALRFPSNPWVRYAVARDLGKQGRLAQPLLPALRRNLQDPDRDARHAAEVAFDQIQRAAPEAPGNP